MGSIVYLIAIIMLNMFLKNVQEKRKKEASRDKGISRSTRDYTASPRKKTDKGKAKEPSILEEIYGLLTEEIERKKESLSQPGQGLADRDGEAVQQPQVRADHKTHWENAHHPYMKETYRPHMESHKAQEKRERPHYQEENWVGSQAEITESAYKDFSSEHYSRGGHRDPDEEKRLREKERQAKKASFRRDVVNGIIFSEILAKPKSLRRDKNAF